MNRTPPPRACESVNDVVMDARLSDRLNASTLAEIALPASREIKPRTERAPDCANVAAQAQRACGRRHETETRPRCCLTLPGWAGYSSYLACLEVASGSKPDTGSEITCGNLVTRGSRLGDELQPVMRNTLADNTTTDFAQLRSAQRPRSGTPGRRRPIGTRRLDRRCAEARLLDDLLVIYCGSESIGFIKEYNADIKHEWPRVVPTILIPA